MARTEKFIEIPKATIERIAHIVGNGSAAAQALRFAKEQGWDDPQFFEDVKKGTIIVCPREYQN